MTACDQRADVGRRFAPDAVEQRPDPETVDQTPRARFVERRERQPPVMQHLDEHAARRDQHQRPELRVADDPRAPARPRPAPSRPRPPGTEPRGHVVVGARATSGRRPRSSDAADVGLVLDAGRRRLHHDRPSDPLGGRDRFVDARLQRRHATSGRRSRPERPAPRARTTRAPVRDVLANGPGRRRRPAAAAPPRARAPVPVASRCLSAARPDAVPSSTGMPPSRRSAASSFATALARFDSTQNGLVGRREDLSRDLEIAHVVAARPAGSCPRRTPTPRCRGPRAAPGGTR